MARKPKVGTVFSIPLPDGRYAFGRTFLDASIGIYEYIGNSPSDLPKTEKYQFIVGIYEDVLKSGIWKVVDYRPFSCEDDAWPPPTCVIDAISGKCSLYHRGQFHPATEKQCENLEEAAVWEADHIIDRIMGSDKWHKR